MKPICVLHQREMERIVAGVDVIVHANFGPYQIYKADLFECSVCKVRVVHDFAMVPHAEHFQHPHFDQALETAMKSPLTVEVK